MKENRFNNVSTQTLRRYLSEIQEVLKYRGGQGAEEFKNIHVLEECKVVLFMTGAIGSGFYNPEFMNMGRRLAEEPCYLYAYECTFHKARSTGFQDMAKLPGHLLSPELEKRLYNTNKGELKDK